MTSKLRGLFIGALALIGLAGVHPAQAQLSVPMVCGSVAVYTSYVLPQNCELNCRFRGHTPAECAKLVPICRTCWNIYLTLARNRTIPSAQRCQVITARYEACIKPFFK